MQLIRRINLFVISICCWVSASSQDYDIDNPDSLYRMFQIKSEYIYSFKFNNKKISDSLIVKVNTYDSLGRLIKSFNFDDKNKDLLKSTIVYEYNGRLNKLQRTITTDNVLGFSKTKEYTYSENGKLTETVSYAADKDGKGEFNKYEYNDDGKVIKISGKTGVSGMYSLKTENKYQKGLLEKSTDYDEQGTSEYYRQFFYDNTGRLKRLQESANGRNGVAVDYKYDDHGRCKEKLIVFNINSSNYMEQWSLDRGINTPIIEYHLYYPGGLFYEKKAEFGFKPVLIRVYYSTEYPADLQ